MILDLKSCYTILITPVGTPWLVSWRALEKITSVEHYAISGVYYREGVAKIEKTLTERVVLWMYWLQAFRIDNIAKKFNKFLVSF